MRINRFIAFLLTSLLLTACDHPTATEKLNAEQSAYITDASQNSPSESGYHNCINEFKKEYDGENTEFGGLPTEINEKATIYEIDWDKAGELLDSNKDTFILFSASWCPYCKVMIGPLTDALAETDKPIYYVNIEKYPRTQWAAEKNNDTNEWEPVMYEEHKDYEDFLVKFFTNAPDITLPTKTVTTPDGEEIDTGVSRIAVPLLIKANAQSDEKIKIMPLVYEPENGLQEDEAVSLKKDFIAFLNK